MNPDDETLLKSVVRSLTRNREEHTGGHEGGVLHVVIEDANVDDATIRLCILNAEAEEDWEAMMICGGLLLIPDRQDRLEALGWPRDYHDDVA